MNQTRISCVKCSAPLHPRQYGHIAVQSCPECGGCFIAQAMIEPLLAVLASSPEMAVRAALGSSRIFPANMDSNVPRNPSMTASGSGVAPEEPDAAARPSPSSICPGCGGGTERYGYMGSSRAWIDLCAPCGKVWIEPGDLEGMALLYLESKTRQWKREMAAGSTVAIPLAPVSPGIETFELFSSSAGPTRVPDFGTGNIDLSDGDAQVNEDSNASIVFSPGLFTLRFSLAKKSAALGRKARKAAVPFAWVLALCFLLLPMGFGKWGTIETDPGLGFLFDLLAAPLSANPALSLMVTFAVLSVVSLYAFGSGWLMEADIRKAMETLKSCRTDSERELVDDEFAWTEGVLESRPPAAESEKLTDWSEAAKNHARRIVFFKDSIAVELNGRPEGIDAGLMTSLCEVTDAISSAVIASAPLFRLSCSAKEKLAEIDRRRDGLLTRLSSSMDPEIRDSLKASIEACENTSGMLERGREICETTLSGLERVSTSFEGMALDMAGGGDPGDCVDKANELIGIAERILAGITGAGSLKESDSSAEALTAAEVAVPEIES